MKRNVRNVESKATIRPLPVPEFDNVSQGVFGIHQIVVRYGTEPADYVKQAGISQFFEVPNIKPPQFPLTFAVAIPLSTAVYANRLPEDIRCQLPRHFPSGVAGVMDAFIQQMN